MGTFISWFERSYKGIIVVLVAVMAIMLVVLALQHINASKPAAGAQAGPVPTFSSAVSASTTFAVVGDSVTAANSPDIDAGRAGDGSWAFYANRDGARLVGGWALGGATTNDMKTNVRTYKADVLVVLAGTNDTGQGVPFDTTAANLRDVVAATGISKVIVSSIPPRDASPELPPAYNDQLKTLAAAEGWQYVDASSALRVGGQYRSGFTVDGIHPTAEGARALGSTLHEAIVEAG